MGILGALKEELIDVNNENTKELDLLKYTPGGAFGSCRLKLKDFKKSKKDFERIYDVFKAHNIRYFLYNGGGDSMIQLIKLANILVTKNTL